MNYRSYYSMFKNEPDILTVPDVIRLLRIGKNSVYELIKVGAIGSIKKGKKIIIPKVCLIEFLADERNYQTVSPTVPKSNLKCWTSEKECDSVGVAQDTKGTLKQIPKQKGA